MENYQPLAFYKDTKHQYHKRFRAFGNVLPVAAPTGWIPPFQIKVSNHATQINSVHIINLNTGDQTDIQGLMEGVGLGFTAYAQAPYNTIRYRSLSNIDVIPKGYFYLKITTDEPVANEYFSDVFEICSMQGFVKLTYWHDGNFNLPGFHFNFENDFRFFVYLKTELGKPRYAYEDTIHRRDGYNFPEKIISTKQYQCEAFGPEPLWDGLRLARLMNNATLWTEQGTMKAYEIELDVAWDEAGYVGIGTFVFDTANVVKSTGKAQAIAPDFNEDYNEDYLT